MTDRRLPTIKIFLTIFVISVLLGAIRFAHQTPDSKYYIAFAEYLSSGDNLDALRAPYVYRILSSWIVAQLGFSAFDIGFAIINLIYTILAFFVFYLILEELSYDQRTKRLALFLMIFSFPTVNYSTGVLTDPLGFLSLNLCFYFLISKRYYAFSLALSMGVLTREATLVALPALWLCALSQALKKSNHSLRLQHLAFSLVPIFVYLYIRYDWRELGQYYWKFDLAQILIFWFRIDVITPFILTLVPPLLLFAYGYLSKKDSFLEYIKIEQKNTLLIYLFWLLSCLALIIYSSLFACISGRFVWPLYPGLIPLVAIAIKDTKLSNRIFNPICRYLFPN